MRGRPEVAAPAVGVPTAPLPSRRSRRAVLRSTLARFLTVEVPRTTVTVDAQVVASTNPSVARLSTVRVVATRTLTGETVTVSAINPVDNSTGATLYTLTPSVQPQSFVVRVIPSGPFSLPS